jgi:uncharacterized protein YjdB
MIAASRMHQRKGMLAMAAITAAVAIVVMVCSSGVAHAIADQVVFGPKQYLRSGGGTTTDYSDTLTVPSNIGSPFLLHIVNGQSNGKNRVSSAWITINNTQVAGQTDFGQNVAVVDRSITLNPGTNQLVVRVGSTPGAFLTITVYGTKIPPTPTSLTPNPLNLTVGSSGVLIAAIGPAPTAPDTLTVSSSNPAIATVPGSVAFATNQTTISIPVTAPAAGNASIIVSLNGGTISATVAVSETPATIASLLPTTQTLTQGGTGNLTCPPIRRAPPPLPQV